MRGFARRRAGPAGPADAAWRERCRALERLLAREGLVDGPRPVSGPGVAGEDPRRPWALRLAAVLAELGPVPAAFGRFLADRPDLLGASDRAVLARGLPDLGPPVDEPSLVAFFTAELGRAQGELFARFDAEPVHSGLLDQVHRARLAGGGEVRVRLVRPEIDEGLDEDLALLERLAPAVALALPPGLPVEELLAAFREDLAAALDLAGRAAALEAFRPPGSAADVLGGDRDLPVLPAVEPRLSTRRVLTTLAVPGPAAGEVEPGGPAAYERARALHRAWLRLGLEGRGVVVAGEVEWLAGGRPALDAPRLAARAAGPLGDLGEYLRAVAAHEPDRAFELLRRDLEATPRALPGAELAKRMRQAVPFGDSAVAGGDSVADHALLHWRLARECGYRPSARLEAFYRGLLWSLGAAGWTGGSDPDPLRDAIEDGAWRSGWDDLRAMADPQRVWTLLEGHMGTFAALPATLERAVAALERIDEGHRPSEAATQREAGTGGGAAALAALGLAMVAVALLAGEASAAGAAWAEPLGGVAFVGLGGLLLRFAWGRR